MWSPLGYQRTPCSQQRKQQPTPIPVGAICIAQNNVLQTNSSPRWQHRMSSQTTATTRLIYSQQRSNKNKTALIASSRLDKTPHATLVWVVILNPHGCSCGFVGRVGAAKPQAVLLVLVLASNQQLAQFAKEGRTRFISSLSVGAASIRACLSQYRLRSSASPTACNELHVQGTVLRSFARVVRVEVVQVAPPAARL